MSYLLLKYLHIVSSTILFGTGLGTAFHGWMANRRGSLAAVATVNRNVVAADWIFTTPAVIAQPVTGLLLARLAGYSLADRWLALSLLLYLVAGACWLPVVRLQIRMRRMADEALAGGHPLPPLYMRYARLWFLLGWPAFGAVLAIFFLMTVKPSF